MTQDLNAALRSELNTRVSEHVESAWPTLYQALKRMARAQWEVAPLGATPRRRWTLTTTLRLLEAPKPTDIETKLGIACACVHVELQYAMRATIEGWTVTFRAFPDRDEVQVTGASIQVSTDLTARNVTRMLRLARHDGPGRYELNNPGANARLLHRVPPAPETHPTSQLSS